MPTVDMPEWLEPMAATLTQERFGTGGDWLFDTRLLLDLRQRLDPIGFEDSPFTRAVGLPRLEAHWVRPQILVQVSSIEWTHNDKFRHPRLIGVRLDKDLTA